MATTFGNTVQVSTAAQYEKLIGWATSISGWFDPTKQYGEVVFTSVRAACIARACL